jgi:hypothetical protein
MRALGQTALALQLPRLIGLCIVVLLVFLNPQHTAACLSDDINDCHPPVGGISMSTVYAIIIGLALATSIGIVVVGRHAFGREPRTKQPRWILVLVSAGVLFGLFVMAGLLFAPHVGGVIQQTYRGVELVSMTKPVNTYKAQRIGETITLSHLQLTILETRPFACRGKAIPAYGTECLAVTAIFTNTGAEAVQIQQYQTAIQTGFSFQNGSLPAQQFVYSLPAAATVPVQDRDIVWEAWLQSGQTTPGTFYYEVPISASPLFWTYQPTQSTTHAVVRIR